jgi:hypothetical protein
MQFYFVLSQCFTQSEDKPEELVKLEELLGVSFPHHQSDAATSDTQQEANLSDPVNKNLTFTLNAKNPDEVKETGTKS